MNCLQKLFGITPKPADVIPIKPGTVMAPKPTPGPKTLGIDVSHYEPELDWPKAKAGGVAWMYTKASEGAGHVDAYLHKHAGAAQSAGVYAGAYHFFHASVDGAAQAALYLKTVDGMSLNLPHSLDWESSSADGLSPLKQKTEALKWLDAVEKASGRPPVIYGGEAHLRSLSLGPAFLKYPLWLAHYGVSESGLKIPAPWSRYTMWQYTDAESITGLATGHHVDANWFNGSLDELKSFIAKG